MLSPLFSLPVRLQAVEDYTNRRACYLRGNQVMLAFIVGRGTHSGASGPKLRPAVERYLREQNVFFCHTPNPPAVYALLQATRTGTPALEGGWARGLACWGCCHWAGQAQAVLQADTADPDQP